MSGPSYPSDCSEDERVAWGNTLANLRVLHAATDETLRRLLDEVVFRRWGAGEVIINASAPAGRVFFLVDGVLRAYQEEGENQYTAKLLTPPVAFGELAQIAGESDYRSCVLALTPAVVADVSFGLIEQLLAVDPGMARAWLYSVTRQFSVAIDVFKQSMFGGVSARLCNTLLTYAQVFGDDVDDGWRRVGFELTYQALAGEAACTRRFAIKTMQQLCEAGSVRRDDDGGWSIRVAELEEAVLPGRLSLHYTLSDDRDPDEHLK